MKFLTQVTEEDCFRTCIACILDMDSPEDVPDPYWNSSTHYHKGMFFLEQWLSERGLAILQFSVDWPMEQERISLDEVHERLDSLNHILPPLIITGETHFRDYHSVVMYDGGKIHDPSPKAPMEQAVYPVVKEGNSIKYFLVKTLIPAWRKIKPRKIRGARKKCKT